MERISLSTKVLLPRQIRLLDWLTMGISVTSENARNLVRYLSDIENYNIDLIGTQMSTSKLGWIEGEFMPYGANIIFDNETRFKETYESIHEQGSEDIWLNMVRKIRKSDRFEPKIYLVASLASALIEPLNALPFTLNLWGDTGKGKDSCDYVSGERVGLSWGQ